jgi:hypothetical protein
MAGLFLHTDEKSLWRHLSRCVLPKYSVLALSSIFPNPPNYLAKGAFRHLFDASTHRKAESAEGALNAKTIAQLLPSEEIQYRSIELFWILQKCEVTYSRRRECTLPSRQDRC